ncbi:P-loop containing nucleoside triphosphate hydrolase protein, partial [Hymenopellis radicata]
MLGVDFWEGLSLPQGVVALRASLLLWICTQGDKVPKRFQLEAILAVEEGKDSDVDVGTGYGKTFCMLIVQLLHPLDVAFIISPLKLLHAAQTADFLQYGISTICINEDTPEDDELWLQIRSAFYKVLIVAPEQLTRFEGKPTWLSRLLSDTKPHALVHRVKRVFIDEAHNIHLLGQDLYGIPTFRSAYRKIGHFRLKLGSLVPFQALSGTQPPHIKKTIIESLNMKEDMVSIKLSSNRPNVVYASHPIVGSRNDLRNLDFLIGDSGAAPSKKILIFHDNSEETVRAAAHSNHRLHSDLQWTGVCRHYHSSMSAAYRDAVFKDFSSPNGIYKLLFSTKGASTGLDVRAIFAVILFGLTREMVTALQRGGRVWRTLLGYGIVLIMYEAWAITADLSEHPLDGRDPDQPLKQPLTAKSKKPERTSIGMYHLVQDTEICIRQFFATYLNDTSLTALEFTAPWCCDRHSGNGFDLTSHFDGALL